MKSLQIINVPILDANNVKVGETQRVAQSSVAILNRSGEQVGEKFTLGTGPIAACRKQLREAGLSAKQANDKMGEFLRGGGGNLQWAQAMTLLEVARAKGQFATSFELRDKSFVLRGAVAPGKAKAVSPEQAMATKLGITLEAFNLMVAAATPKPAAPIEV